MKNQKATRNNVTYANWSVECKRWNSLKVDDSRVAM